MSENNCNNCMLLKKGDCFGKSVICEDFRYSPSMSSSDKENWPTIMQTSAHANHINYKREQEKREKLSKTETVVRVVEKAKTTSNVIPVSVNEKNDSKEIIDLLICIANGKNPITGEMFDTKELYDNPELHRITKELDDIAAGRKKPESINRLNRPSVSIFEQLKEWRLSKASERNLPAYCIFKDKELWAIAEGDICKKEDLLRVNGISDYKYELYGEELYKIISLYYE